MLVRYIGDVLQIQVRKQMVGNWIADNRSVGFLIVNEQPQRQQRNNLFVNGARRRSSLLAAEGPAPDEWLRRFIVAKGGKTNSASASRPMLSSSGRRMFCMDSAAWCSLVPSQQLHTGGADVGGDVNLHAVKGDPNMIGALYPAWWRDFATGQARYGSCR